MTIQMMLSKPFPIDIIFLLTVAFLAGFAWHVAVLVVGRLLR